VLHAKSSGLKVVPAPAFWFHVVFYYQICKLFARPT
jgi:hypothetical protein